MGEDKGGDATPEGEKPGEDKDVFDDMESVSNEPTAATGAKMDNLGGPADLQAPAPDERENLSAIISSWKARGRPPIIVMFGFSGSGKTTFAYRVELLGAEDAKDPYSLDPSVAPDGEVFNTSIIQHYWMNSPNKDGRALLIDLPGETFRLARESKFRGDIARDMLTLIGAADAYVFFLEADKTLYPDQWKAMSLGEKPEARLGIETAAKLHAGFINDIMAFADLDGRLQKAILAKGDIDKGVDAFREAARSTSSLGVSLRSRKPALVALSLTDRLLESLPKLGLPDVDEGNLDFDPMLVTRYAQKPLYNRLLTCFRVFRIDFVTAFKGLDKAPAIILGDRIGAKVDRSSAHFGVKRNFAWLRNAARRERRRLRLPWARRIGLAAIADLLDALPSAYDTQRVLKAREAWDLVLANDGK